jgi:four helix bundle protein
MEKAERFEDLWIWQQARELVRHIYEDFRAGKGSKDFGFCDQIRRSGVSIMSNVAEGFERSSNADFARYLDIAKGSCGEVRSLYHVAEDLGYVDAALATERRVSARRLAAGIASLASHLRRHAKPRNPATLQPCNPETLRP